MATRPAARTTLLQTLLARSPQAAPAPAPAPARARAHARAFQAPRHRRPFSIMHSLRTFARSFEPHPFQRLPAASRPAPADWGRLVRRAGGQVVVYFPVALALLGWPYVGRVLLDGRV